MCCMCIYLWSRELVNCSCLNLHGWATTSVSINRLWQLRLLRNFTDEQWHISRLVLRYIYTKEDMIYANHSWTWTLSRRVCMCVYIYGKMVVYIITIHIHLYIHWIYDFGRVLRLILSLLYYSYTITWIYKKEQKSEIFIHYRLILISRMNTYDNLCNLLTIIINERRCFNDEKKTNEQYEEHCILIR